MMGKRTVVDYLFSSQVYGIITPSLFL